MQVENPTGDKPTGDTPKRGGGPNVLYFVLYLFCFLSFFTNRKWKLLNHMFNGTMFQGVKFRVDSTNSQVCSLWFDLFHEGFEFG